MKGLSLVIPAHNSEGFIESSLKRYYNAFSKEFKDLEIIVVCNACTDNTKEVCSSLKSEMPIKVISTPKKGKGRALYIGLNHATKDIIGFLDADNPFDLNKIIQLIKKLDGYDMVMASKYLRGRKKKQDAFMRRMLALGASLFSRIFFNMNFRDTQAGAKFMKKQTWNKLKTNFICHGFDFDIELLYRIKKNNLSIVETYIPFKTEEFSTVNLTYIPGMIYRLLKLRFIKNGS